MAAARAGGEPLGLGEQPPCLGQVVPIAGLGGEQHVGEIEFNAKARGKPIGLLPSLLGDTTGRFGLLSLPLCPQ